MQHKPYNKLVTSRIVSGANEFIRLSSYSFRDVLSLVILVQNARNIYSMNTLSVAF